jgi:hypothetical protein
MGKFNREEREAREDLRVFFALFAPLAVRWLSESLNDRQFYPLIRTNLREFSNRSRGFA